MWSEARRPNAESTVGESAAVLSVVHAHFQSYQIHSLASDKNTLEVNFDPFCYLINWIEWKRYSTFKKFYISFKQIIASFLRFVNHRFFCVCIIFTNRSFGLYDSCGVDRKCMFSLTYHSISVFKLRSMKWENDRAFYVRLQYDKVLYFASFWQFF